MFAKDENFTGELIGYARVSTDDQSLDMQIEALMRAGVPRNNIHAEKISGVSKVRPKLENALKHARRGDIFVVWRLDRMGRSLMDLLTKIQALEKRGIAFKSLTENIDSTTATGKLVLSMTAAFAEFERNLIAERTREGMRIAKAKGRVVSPQAKIDWEKAKQLFGSGKTVQEVADHFGVHRSAVYQRCDARQRAHWRDEWLRQRKRNR